MNTKRLAYGLAFVWSVASSGLAAGPAQGPGQEQETSMPGVTARLAYLRQYNGALHLGIVLKNTGDKEATGLAIPLSGVVLLDAKNGRKQFAFKDESGHFIGGPISDWNGGGRWFPKIAPHADTLIWALFGPVSAGAKVQVQVPGLQPFDDAPVSEQAPAPVKEVASSTGGYTATLMSADRAEGQLKVRLKIVKTWIRAPASSPALRYADAFVLDPASRRKYELVRDSEGRFVADPVSDQNEGGRLFLSKVPAGGSLFMSLTFTAPPDAVRTADIVVPQFGPFEGIPLAGRGGAAESGTAVTGRSVGLQQALEALNADVTPQRVRVNLSADVLFDFDKADLRPEAAASLASLATVIRSYPGAAVTIDGYTDGKGNDAYNVALSERRANAVSQWLIGNSAAAAVQLHTKGWGRANPVAPNTKPDGSDNPEGRAKNRRVEITIVHT